ncbi:MAG TPA: hypothetical protein VNG69_08465, partial [Casimicrobiaceae bacterium]|nr:hypothetical protein [Casimicrobiaceae bacterium]
FLNSRSNVRLIPLQAYVGCDRYERFRIRELSTRDPAFRPALKVLREQIPIPGRVASEQAFRLALAYRSPECRYHLWALSGRSRRIDGVASFFTLRPAGFGGYIVLKGPLKGKGLLRLLIASMERQMIDDAFGSQGWFIECDDESAAPFVKCGFLEVCVDYCPPRVGTRASGAEQLKLLYKPFGVPYEAPQITRRFVLDAISAFLKRVYGVSAPRTHHCYKRARKTLGVDAEGNVVWADLLERYGESASGRTA